MDDNASTNNSEITIIYDGECPLCKHYVTHLRLRQAFGKVTLVNARNDIQTLKEMTELNLDLNDGMVVKVNDRIHHGDKAINVLALMSTKSDFFNRINGLVFSRPLVSRFIYPFMKFGRSCLLKVLGKRKLNQ